MTRIPQRVIDRLKGFKPLKPDRIHFRCGQCGRKPSNNHRDPFDPPRAVLIEFGCNKHSDQGETFFYDAEGKELSYEEVETQIELVCALEL